MADIERFDFEVIVDSHAGNPFIRCISLFESFIIYESLFVLTHVFRPKPIIEKKSIANFHARNMGAIKSAREFVNLFFV
jgi:hypothetical protein